MGYYERKAVGAAASGLFVICGACLIAVGPWMIGKAIAGPALGWVLEVLYIALIAWLLLKQAHKARRQKMVIAHKYGVTR